MFVTEFDFAVKLNTAASISLPLMTDTGANPGTFATARWNQSGQFLQTRPSGNACTLLMATLNNTAGSNVSQLAVSYDFASIGFAGEDAELAGHRVYFSISGNAGSWTLVPELTRSNTGMANVILDVGAWPAGSNLYLLFADDNGNMGSDGAFTIDNFLAAISSPIAIGITTNPPANTNVVQGHPVTFCVEVIGPSPRYQWSKAGSGSIAGATSSCLTITNAQFPNDTGDYFCTITNTLNSATSSSTHLNVIQDTNGPYIMSAEIDLSDTNLVVEFNEAVDPGVATDPFNWTLGVIGGDGLIIEGPGVLDSPTTLRFKTMPVTPGISYHLDGLSIIDLFGNTMNEPTNRIPVKVLFGFKNGRYGYAGTRDTHIQATTPDETNATSLFVLVDESAPVSHGLLRFNDIFGTGSNRIPLGSQIISARLQFLTRNEGDSPRFYRMLVDWDDTKVTWNSMVNGIDTNGVEATTTADAIMIPRPTLVGETRFVDVTASVQAWADNAPNYGWAILPGGDNGYQFASSENPDPIIRPCLIIDLSAPVITSQPQGLTVIAGTNVAFTVGVAGSFPLSYQWRLNGNDIAGATSPTLTFSNVQPVNVGAYSVVVGNSFGSVTSTIVALTVRYSLTLSTNGVGTVTPDPALFNNYLPNFVVTLTAVPGSGNQFDKWSGGIQSTNNPLTLVMDGNKNITANFASSVLNVGIQGQGSVSRTPEAPLYSSGEQVTLTATAGGGHAFTRWSDGVTANPRVITIGLSNSYTAIFTPTTPLETLTFGNVSRTAPIGMPAVFVDGEFVVTGAVTRLASTEIAMLTTFPNGTLLFTLDGTTPSFSSRLYYGPFTLRRSFTIRAIAYDAFFTQSWEADPVEVIVQPTYSLNAATAGGGSVSVSPTNSPYLSNTMATVTATPAAGWTFLQWLGDATGANPSAPVPMTRDKCVQAVFGTTLSNSVTGSGSILTSPVATFYPYGTVVNLTAIPQPGNYFALWGNSASGSVNPLAFVVTNANPIVSLLFAPLSAGQHALTVIANGNGKVTPSPRANRYNSGQAVTLTAMPEAGQSFLGWSTDAGGTQNPLTVTVTQSKVITANFTKRPGLAVVQCLGELNEGHLEWTLTSTLGERYGIEASPDLNAWTPLFTLTNRFGTTQFADPSDTNRTQRFYRAVQVP